MLENDFYLIFFICPGPIVSVFIIWQVIRLMGWEYWLRVPRESELKQYLQDATPLVFSFILFSLVQFIAPNISRQKYNLFVNPLLFLTVITGMLFVMVLKFMQSWIDREWVKWVSVNYLKNHREILLFASRGDERRRWRKSKDFEEFQNWVKDHIQTSPQT